MSEPTPGIGTSSFKPEEVTSGKEAGEVALPISELKDGHGESTVDVAADSFKNTPTADGKSVEDTSPAGL